MPDLTPLVSLTTIASLTLSKKRSLLAAVTKELGKDWKPETVDDALGLPVLHAPTKLRFRLIPGGVFTMGLTQEDIEQCDEYAGDYPDEIAALKKRATPLRQVTVGPFLCTEQPLDHNALKRLVPGYDGDELPKRKTALEVAEQHGFRLPSEAELEWLARNGAQAPFVTDLVATKALSLNEAGSARFNHKKSTSRFGMKELLSPVWAADDWHADYKDAPTSSEPWLGGKADGVVRWTNLTDIFCAGHELLWGFLSAMRHKPGEPGQVRLAAPLSRWVTVKAKPEQANPAKKVELATVIVKGQVDWKKLKTKTGNGEKLPKLLKQVAAGGAKGEPVTGFMGAVLDQILDTGKWYSASVPLLEEALLSLPKAVMPEMLLTLMSHVVGADHVRAWLAPPTEPTHAPILKVLDCHRKLVLAQLKSEVATVRSAAATLLVTIGEWRGETIPALVAMAKEDAEPFARASALLALSRLGADRPDCVDLIRSMASDGTLPNEVRGSVAVAMLRVDATASYDSVHEGLRAWFGLQLRPPQGPHQPKGPFHWFGATGPDQTYEHPPMVWPLYALSARRADTQALLETLLTRLATKPDPRVIGALQELVIRLGGFDEYPGNKGIHTLLPQDFRPEQRKLLPLLARAWVPVTASFGLPAPGPVRRRWLGLDPPGPLETPVESDCPEPQLRWQCDDPIKRFAGLGRLERWRTLLEGDLNLYCGEYFFDDEDLPAELDGIVCDDEFEAYARPIIEELTEQRSLAWKVGAESSVLVADALIFLPFLRAGRGIETRWLVPIDYEDTFVKKILKLLSEEQMAEYFVRMFEQYPQNHLFGQILEMRPSYAATKALLERLPKPGAIGFDRDRFEQILTSIQDVAHKKPVAKALKEACLAKWWELLKC